MANITLNMPNAELTRIEDGFAEDNNYETNKLPGPPVETKNEFLQRLILAFVTNGFANGEGAVAGKSARDTAEAAARAVAITIS